jgi:hypothetical protein
MPDQGPNGRDEEAAALVAALPRGDTIAAP